MYFNMQPGEGLGHSHPPIPRPREGSKAPLPEPRLYSPSTPTRHSRPRSGRRCAYGVNPSPGPGPLTLSDESKGRAEGRHTSFQPVMPVFHHPTPFPVIPRRREESHTRANHHHSEILATRLFTLHLCILVPSNILLFQFSPWSIVFSAIQLDHSRRDANTLNQTHTQSYRQPPP